MANQGEELIQFKSFEETLVVLATLMTAAIAFRLFKTTLLTAVLIGALAAAAVAYATFFEFTLAGDTITYRNRFRQLSFPLSYVEKVGMRTFWTGLPGHTFMFTMRRPPAPMNGYFLRTGLVSWPSATDWVEAVNKAARSQTPNPK
jgi:hypothetical protein